MDKESNKTFREITFRPYIAYRIFGIMMAVMSLCPTLLLFYGDLQTLDKVVLGATSVACIFFAWYFNAWLPMTVTLNDCGIRVTNRRTGDSIYSEWNRFQGAYYLRNGKGHAFLLLTEKPLDQTSQVRLYRKLIRLPRGKVPGAEEWNVCFPMNWYGDKVLDLCSEKMPHFDRSKATRFRM